jgi:hypothetical protein
MRDASYDPLTVAALGVVAMCLVTAAHEVVGHGVACLVAGGHILVLTSSIFRCDVGSLWVAPAGPAGNLLAALAAMLTARAVPPRHVTLRLLLVLIACLGCYWEAGYAIHAMLRRDGDLYFAGRDLIGEPSAWWRLAGGAAGIGLYLVSTRWLTGMLSSAWPRSATARGVARTAWLSATLGAVVAAGACATDRGADLRDAFLEIGLASVPLLLVPRGRRAAATTDAAAILPRSWVTVGAALIVYALFVATLGRGLFFRVAHD